MLMYFIKVGNNLGTDDWTILNYANTSPDYLYCKERVKTALDKTFPSVCYKTDNVPALYFNFDDPADEAFFLI